jgi:hypothetical protein
MEANPKFRRLFRTLDEVSYYAAVGVYVAIVLRAWATASREVESSLRLLLPGKAVEDLLGVGLLDDGGALPVEVFDRWVGPVLAERTRDANRKMAARRGGPVSSSSVGLQRIPSESDVEESRGEESRGDQRRARVSGVDDSRLHPSPGRLVRQVRGATD